MDARIDLALTWFKPAGPVHIAGGGTFALQRGADYAVDAREAGRALLLTEPDDAGLLAYAQAWGPLTDPVDGRVSITSMRLAREQLLEVQQKWGRDAGLMKDFGDRRALSLIRQQASAPVFSGMARAAVRLELAGDPPTLTARPADLLSLLWLAAARRILYGEASRPCRNLNCPHRVIIRPGDTNSMRQLYCAATRGACTMHVRRHPEDDRWPALRGLTHIELRAAAAALPLE